MADEVAHIMKDIKSLKIQGARRIADAAAKAMALAAKKSAAKTADHFIAEMEKTANKLVSLRSTEPMVRNTMKYFMARLEKGRNVKEMKSIAAGTIKQYDKEFTDSFMRITRYGSDLIWDGQTVLTHCHSTTVNSILIHAHKRKKVRVICTETRPRFQGHLTAKQLSDAGVDVTMVVDSAVRYVMKDVDMVIVGSDSITADGSLYNKIGTSMVATVAHDKRVPFYSATQLYKFDPISKWGRMTEIEERPTNEVLAKKMKGVKILNPAFDITEPEYIRAYITEAGIVPPQEIGHVAEKYAKI
jgi:ribose 1,5-bisphosphate isomerase